MARYIDADELYETVTKKYSDIVAGCYPYNIVAYDMARLVKEAPAADVVPRGEVEELNRAYLEYEETSGLKQAKTEIAREIFEGIVDDCFDQFGYLDYDAFYALKKKYTEGQNNQ